MAEFTYTNEGEAKRIRRMFIDRGRRTSLIAFDPAREVFAFDVEEQDPQIKED